MICFEHDDDIALANLLQEIHDLKGKLAATTCREQMLLKDKYPHCEAIRKAYETCDEVWYYKMKVYDLEKELEKLQ